MTEGQRKKPQTISREELYRQMWQTPASRLCAEYGISGRGLKKVCDRLNVPSPPRGYWARLAAGKRIKQTPLPDAAPGGVPKVTITPSFSETSAAPALDTETSESLGARSSRSSRHHRPCETEPPPSGDRRLGSAPPTRNCARSIDLGAHRDQAPDHA